MRRKKRSSADQFLKVQSLNLTSLALPGSIWTNPSIERAGRYSG